MFFQSSMHIQGQSKVIWTDQLFEIQNSRDIGAGGPKYFKIFIGQAFFKDFLTKLYIQNS